MNTEKFRYDLTAWLGKGNRQSELARQSGVSQITICKFVNKYFKNISFENASKLWPIIYGKPMGDAECQR